MTRFPSSLLPAAGAVALVVVASQSSGVIPYMALGVVWLCILAPLLARRPRPARVPADPGRDEVTAAVADLFGPISDVVAAAERRAVIAHAMELRRTRAMEQRSVHPPC